MSPITKHPMDVNVNTRIRWDVLRHPPFAQSLIGKRVLDVGSGLGFFSLRFKELGAEVLAADIDAAALEHIRRHYGIETLLFDIVSQPMPAGSFDIVFIGEVMEHITDQRSLLEKIRNSLNPGGQIIITTPAMEGAFIHTKGKALGHEHGAEKHERDGFYKQELVEMFQAVGMQVSAYRSCVFYLSELFMQFTKLMYFFKRKTYHGQSEVIAVQNTFSYKALDYAFPLLLLLFRLEESVLSALGMSGHCHVISATQQDA